MFQQVEMVQLAKIIYLNKMVQVVLNWMIQSKMIQLVKMIQPIKMVKHVKKWSNQLKWFS